MSLPLDTLLRAIYPAFDPTKAKLHLAQWNGYERPLDVFDEGQFELWQNSQNARNFSRDYVVSLIETQQPNIWMFAGIWRVDGLPSSGPCPYSTRVGRSSPTVHIYRTQQVAEVADLAGRLHIKYRKTARAAYRLYETVASDLLVSSLVDAPRSTPRFQGYRDVRLSWPLLTRILADQPEDWRTALSSVGGVYLISTQTGQQYVGSAGGAQGFWTRWTDYAATGGHGGNAALRALLSQDGRAAQGFQFSILETADVGAPLQSIIARETHWKRVLGTRATGLNLN